MRICATCKNINTITCENCINDYGNYYGENKYEKDDDVWIDSSNSYVFDKVDVRKITGITIGFSEGVWILMGKLEDKIYVLAEGKTLDNMQEGIMKFRRDTNERTNDRT